jgi:assimilatory nitrate reductase catalytic subunit
VQNQTTQLKQTTCPYCGVGCGIDVNVTSNTLTSLSGTPEHPANFGQLCVKGSNLIATTSLHGRLLQPEINGAPASWSQAISLVANKFNDTIKRYGPDSVAFYVSGQLLTEDYYVANKLMKGYIGSANIDTNSRLCMSSAVTAYKRAFGEDIVPCDYHDLSQTDLVVLVGSNAAWTHPILYQRIEKAKRIRPQMKVVLIDPRKTASAALADLHLPIAPGSDSFVFNGLLQYLAKNNQLDHEFIAKHTEGFDAALHEANQLSLPDIAKKCQLDQHQLLTFYQWFANSKSSISFYSQGVNQSHRGTDHNNSIINCHLASGKIGKVGSGPFSITGQPNAMGGREVGGLSNTLAAHLSLENEEHRQLVQTYWQSPTIAQQPGYKTVELFEKIRQGKVKAIWIMATNPVVSLPNHQAIIDALKQCDFVVVSDCVTNNDTLQYADVKLPATTWSEKNGTVTNSERRISRQRGLVKPPGESRHDWQIICEVARAMGFNNGFNYQHPVEIFTEYAALTAYKNQGERALNLGKLATLSQQEYDQLPPLQWPELTSLTTCSRPFADGRFYTENHKARFIAITPELTAKATSKHYPFSLTSGRIRDQWHTMTRTGKTRVLTEHTKRPMLHINPQDAAQLTIVNDDCVRVFNDIGSIVVNAVLDEDIPQGRCFVPIHWSQQFASHANVSELFASITDKLSGQPELKHAPVMLEKIKIAQYLEVYSPVQLTTFCQSIPHECYWSCYQAAEEQGDLWVYQFQLPQHNAHFVSLLKDNITQQLSSRKPVEQWLTFSSATQQYIVGLQENHIEALIYTDQQPISLNHQWLNALFNQTQTSEQDISNLLAGRSPENLGRKICSCFNVYEKTIVEALQSGSADSVESLGNSLKCGTNCGSCKTELQFFVDRECNMQRVSA